MVLAIIIVLLLYVFVGIWSFVPYFLGFIPQLLRYPLDIFRYNIYPVGDIVYWVLSGVFIYLLVKFFIFPFQSKNG